MSGSANERSQHACTFRQSYMSQEQLTDIKTTRTTKIWNRMTASVLKTILQALNKQQKLNPNKISFFPLSFSIVFIRLSVV